MRNALEYCAIRPQVLLTGQSLFQTNAALANALITSTGAKPQAIAIEEFEWPEDDPCGLVTGQLVRIRTKPALTASRFGTKLAAFAWPQLPFCKTCLSGISFASSGSEASKTILQLSMPGETQVQKPMFPVPNEAQSAGASDAKWFAGLAMQAIIQKHPSIPNTEAEREEIALWSWRMGQAMAATETRIGADVE